MIVTFNCKTLVLRREVNQRRIKMSAYDQHLDVPEVTTDKIGIAAQLERHQPSTRHGDGTHQAEHEFQELRHV